MNWEEVAIEDVPFEDLKMVLIALFKHQILTLERFRWHDSGQEFRVTSSIIEE